MNQTRWTAADIPSQAGKLAILTGSTSGIGYQVALALTGAGAHVVIAARNEKKGEDAIAAIRRTHAHADLTFRLVDTARLTSVRAFATGWEEEGRPIDILVLNAGIASVPQREETEDGFERQLATNYLGHFALTGLLLPRVKTVYGSRIVQVASIAHRRAQLHFEDVQLKSSYDPGVAYNQSKLAILMFGLELDRRLRAAQSQPRSIPAHPGMAVTDVFRRGERAGTFQQVLGKAVFRIVGQSAAQGALPILFAATSADAEGGIYYGPDGFREIRGHPTVAKIAPHALDRHAAKRLWSMSEELTGVRYPF
jgi:NAD(P)-dependent dehydrogenase (short-subunit alcohol dehydrogenase family)